MQRMTGDERKGKKEKGGLMIYVMHARKVQSNSIISHIKVT